MSQPFDDIRALLSDLPAPGETAAFAAPGAFAPVAAWIAAWRGRAEVNRPILALYAGAHAGAGEGGDPAAQARARLEAIASGEAAVARAAQHLGAGLDVFDLAIERPVADIAKAAAMSERACAATMAFGMEALAKQPDLLLLAGFGPGAEDSAGALAAALSGGGETSARGAAAVERAAGPAAGDPLQLLRELGGRESAALAGAIIAARTQRVPVLLAGASALAAAGVLSAIDPGVVAHCRLAGAHPLAQAAGVPPAFDLDLGLDEGTTALAALTLVRLACASLAGGPVGTGVGSSI